MYQNPVTDINEFLVRDALRERGELTRKELSDDLGLSPASISRIVRRLVNAGVVSEEATSSDGPGRKSDLIRFNSRSACVIAVDLGGTKCHGVIADLAAEVLAEDYRPTHDQGDPTKALLGCIATLRSEAEGRGLEVRAVVIGVPAVPDPDSGLIVSGPNVHWEGYDLIGLLREALAEPFRIENDVTLAAIGEAWRGQGRALSGFVTLSLGTGIGGAIFANGQLVRGRHNSAGEIGYLLTNRAQLRDADGTAALEAVASGPALAARARELLGRAGAESSLSPDDVTAADVFRAAAEGDDLAERVIDELIDYVAMAVVDVAAVLDPERIILDGSIGRALEPYVDRIVERVAPCVPHLPDLRFCRLGPNATVIGAIAGALALEREADARRALGELPTDRIQALPSIPPYGALADADAESR
jgi:glucokinase